jgi:hypothetical protein
MTATRIAVVGTVFFLLSISAVVYLVSSVVFATDIVTALATAGITIVAGWAWFYVPLVRFRHKSGSGA